MHEIDAYDENKALLMDWFSRSNKVVKPVQFLLAVDYINNYGYPVETACLLALDSYTNAGS